MRSGLSACLQLSVRSGAAGRARGARGWESELSRERCLETSLLERHFFAFGAARTEFRARKAVVPAGAAQRISVPSVVLGDSRVAAKTLALFVHVEAELVHLRR